MKSIDKGLATLCVCALGAFSMYLTEGQVGIGWSLLGVFLIWIS